MKTARIIATAGAFAIAGVGAGLGTAAHAEGLGVEAGYGRAEGHWGAELGAGYAADLAGFRLSGGGGIYLRDGDERLYGRVEGTFALPMMARIGAGVRISGDDPRPYATLAMPLLPKLSVKGNAGPKYAAVGLTLGY